jgi:hypothetical protein
MDAFTKGQILNYKGFKYRITRVFDMSIPYYYDLMLVDKHILGVNYKEHLSVPHNDLVIFNRYQ